MSSRSPSGWSLALGALVIVANAVGCRQAQAPQPTPSASVASAVSSSPPSFASASAVAPAAPTPKPAAPAPALPTTQLTFTTPPLNIRFESTAKLKVESEPDDVNPVAYRSGTAKVRLIHSRKGARSQTIDVEQIDVSAHGANGDGTLLVTFDAEGKVVHGGGSEARDTKSSGGPEATFVLAHRPPNTVATAEVGFLSERMWSQFYVYNVVRVAERRYTVIREVWQTDQRAPVEGEPITKVLDFDAQ